MYPKPTQTKRRRLVASCWDPSRNQLLAIKRVSLQRKCKVKLDIIAPSELGEKKYTLYFMYDSYLGCDQRLGKINTHYILCVINILGAIKNMNLELMRRKQWKMTKMEENEMLFLEEWFLQSVKN